MKTSEKQIQAADKFLTDEKIRQKVTKIFAAVLEEINGYTKQDAKQAAPKCEGSELWDRIEKIIRGSSPETAIDFLEWKVKSRVRSSDVSGSWEHWFSHAFAKRYTTQELFNFYLQTKL